MKCYYEILSIPREADDAEIKAAYRKMALKYHPDKNLDNPEFAKEQFQLVQQAYEVLSDRQERAWYDNHREQILRGSNSEYKDDSLNVFQYFTTSCFKGYEDDENGFYSVYRKVFETLAKEEIDHVDSKSDYDDIPMFGYGYSEYEEVVAPFYAYWMSFSTSKSYVWLSPYDINEARERRLLKLIEKENKKVRQKAKKERNEEIRSLIAFVRKRDKRVQAYSKLLEQKNLENRQKHEEIRKQKIRERRKELDESGSQAEWSKFENLSNELKQIEKNLVEQFGDKISDSEDDEDYVEDSLYCVACNKVFKNAKAFANHESSKKHKENIAKLKEEMLEDEEEELEEEDECDTAGSDENEELEEENTKSDCIEKQNEIPSDRELNISSEDEILERSNQQKKKSKKNKKIIKTIDPLSHDEQSGHSESEAAAFQKINTRKISDDDDDDDGFSTKKQKNKKKKNITKNSKPTTGINKVNDEIEKIDVLNTFSAVNTSNKNDKKSKKKKNSKINNTDASVEEINLQQACVICKVKFDSKNKLFEHLKKTGHSVALPPQNVKPNRKGKRNIE